MPVADYGFGESVRTELELGITRETLMTRAFAAALIAFLVMTLHAASPVKLMLLDGESGGPWHKWQSTTPVLKKVLEETGLFQVDVVTVSPSGDVGGLAVKFAGYRAVCRSAPPPSPPS